MSLKFDNGLELNLHNLDKILATFWKELDDDLLLAGPDSLEKSFSYLYAAAR